MASRIISHVQAENRRNRIIFLTAITLGFTCGAWLTEKGDGVANTAKWLLVSALTGLEIVGYVGLLLVVLAEVKMWWATIRLLGIPSFRTMRVFQLASIPMRLRGITHSYANLYFIAIFIILGLNFSWRFLVFGFFFFLVVEMQFQSTVHRPAVAMFLSNSTIENIYLYVRLKRTYKELRIVALLNTDELLNEGDAFQAWMSMVVKGDCLRTYDTDVWQLVVDLLVNNIPLVILDARSPSPAMLYEAGRLMSTNNLYRTIFLASSDGSVPVIDAILPPESARTTLVIVTEENLIPVFRHIMRAKDNLPTPHRSIIDIAQHLVTSEGVPLTRCLEFSA